MEDPKLIIHYKIKLINWPLFRFSESYLEKNEIDCIAQNMC